MLYGEIPLAIFEIFFRASQILGTPINISNNTSSSQGPQVTSSGNNVYVTWYDNTPGNFDIFFRVSNNNGGTFGIPINISNNGGSSARPQIAVSGNNVYVTWTDFTPGLPEIFLAASTNNGGSFGIPVNISNNFGSSESPQIALSGNNIYVTWQDTNLGNMEIFFAASNNNGTSFGTSINLSNNAGFSMIPQIVTSGNNVYVTWQDNIFGGNDILVISNNQPFGFGTPINISNNLGFSENPQIAAS